MRLFSLSLQFNSEIDIQSVIDKLEIELSGESNNCTTALINIHINMTCVWYFQTNLNPQTFKSASE